MIKNVHRGCFPEKGTNVYTVRQTDKQTDRQTDSPVKYSLTSLLLSELTLQWRVQRCGTSRSERTLHVLLRPVSQVLRLDSLRACPAKVNVRKCMR